MTENRCVAMELAASQAEAAVDHIVDVRATAHSLTADETSKLDAAIELALEAATHARACVHRVSA